MDKETVDILQSMNKPVDLKEFKKSLNKEHKVKIIGISANSVTGKNEIENQINDFIKDKNIIDIKFQVIKNYLPHTTQSEYEELWYVLIEYEG